MALLSILRRPLLHQPPLAPPTPLQEQGKLLTRSKFSCPPVTWLKGHSLQLFTQAAVPRHLTPTIRKYDAVHSHGNAPPQPPREGTVSGREELRVTTQTDLHLRTDPRPEQPPASPWSAVPPVQPALWAPVVPPRWGHTARLTADPGRAGSRRPHSAAGRRRCSTATARPFAQIRFSRDGDGSRVPRPVLRRLENPAQLTWAPAGLRDVGAPAPPQPAVPALRRAQPHGPIGSRPARPAPRHPIRSEACASRPMPTPIGGLPPTTPHWLVTRSRPQASRCGRGPEWVRAGPGRRGCSPPVIDAEARRQLRSLWPG